MDISALQGPAGEEKLAQLFRSIESNPVIVVVSDAHGTIRIVNSKFTEASGYSTAEAEGRNIHDLADQDPDEVRQMMQTLAAGNEWRGALSCRKKDGDRYHEEASIFPIQNAFGVITHFVKVAEDVTVRRRTEEAVRFLAFYDDLTELPNRRLFHDRLRQGLARNERSGELLAVIVLDLDRFKKINNSYGHSVGDQVLRIISDRASRRLRSGDTLAHFSGDSFNILLPKINRGENAAKVAQQLIDSIADPIHVQGETLYVTASAGISLYPLDGQDSGSLVKNAELAMQQAQQQGGNRYQIFTPSLNELALRRMALENDLRRALDEGSLALHFQPQFSATSRDLVGAEALVRMPDANGDLVPPNEFIPLAEETGLIVRLSSWVVENACRQAAAFQRTGFEGLRVAVNLSPRDFAQQNLPGFIAGCLNASGLPPACLEVEITEGTLIADFDRTTAILRELKEIGVTVAIDDFGTGYSSLSSLKNLPADILKLDRIFVRGISHTREEGAIARAIIAMAHDLGMRVVAEGVETWEQADILTDLECDLLQGYLLGGPMPAEEFLASAGKPPRRLQVATIG